MFTAIDRSDHARRLRSRAWIVLALASSVACAHNRAPTTSARAAPPHTRDIESSKALLNTALLTGDTSAIRSLLTSDVVVVTPRGDSVVGAAAVARYLVAPEHGVQLRAFAYRPARLPQMCVDGARERGDMTILADSLREGRRVVSRYAVRWRSTPQQGVRISRLSFNQDDSARDEGRQSCRPIELESQPRARVSFGAYPSFLAVRWAPRTDDLGNAYRERGFTGSRMECSIVANEGCTITPGPITSESGGGTEASIVLGARLRSRVNVSLIGGPMRRVSGWGRNTDSTITIQTRLASAYGSAIVSYYTPYFEIGIGPAGIRSTMSATQTTPGRFLADPDVTAKDSWTQTRAGAVGLVRASLPIQQVVRLDVMVVARAFPALRLQRGYELSGTQIREHGAQAGIGITLLR